MATNQLPDYIQQLFVARELTSRDPREVYKDKKIKIKNYPSRDSREDDDGFKVSGETCLLAQRQASVPEAVDSVIEPDQGQGAFGNVIAPPREHTSRWSGIAVQHVRTDRGIKLAIAFQRPEWQAQGLCQLATAELKRADRLREIRARPEDSPQFAAYLAQTRQELQQQRRTDVCMGRLHQRGRRSQWIYDTLVVASMMDQQMQQVLLYLEGEEFVIDLEATVSPAQATYYWSQGRWGQIHSGTRIPRLSDLPLTKFGERDGTI
jgi:hypothetical protein